MTLILLGSVGVLSLLIVVIATLQRRFFWIRQLAFPLYVAAAVATLEIYSRVRPVPGSPRRWAGPGSFSA